MAIKICETCCKAVKKQGRVIACRVLKTHKYFPDKYGYCFAWTDDPDWENKVKAAVEEYALIHQPSQTSTPN